MIKYLIIAIIIILVLTLSFDIVEEFKNNTQPSKRKRRRKGRMRASRHRHSRRRPRRHSPTHSGAYRRPHWRRGPRTRLYDTDDYYWGRWHAISYPKLYDYIPSWFYAPPCRAGCAHTGNGTVGCVNPTNSPDSCIFASDCYGC